MLKQIVGVPMGSPGSPAYAICICMYFEHQFHSSIYDFLRLYNVHDPERNFRFMRYVDDVFGVVTWDARRPHTRALARLVILHLQNCTYHPNMLLKEEPSHGWFPFLEALINFPATGDMRIQFHCKNFVPIRETGLPKIYTIQHRTSFMSRSSAITKVLGALHRLRRTVEEPALVVVNTLQLAVVYRQQGYSAGIFAAALGRLQQRFPEGPIWSHIIPLIYGLIPDH